MGWCFLPELPYRPLPSGHWGGATLRTLGPADLEALAALQAASYAGSIDRFLFASTTEPVSDARRLLQSLFAGDYGTFVGSASFGLEFDSVLRGATLVTQGPTHRLLADVAVHPDVQGRGLARHLIRATLESGFAGSSTPLRLAVTRESPVAYSLYRKLGFVVQDGPFTFWANPAALGIPPPAPVAGGPLPEDPR